MTNKYSETELKLLHGWKDKMSGWRWLHYESMNHYKTINARFVHTSIILSTLAGAGGFSTANDSVTIGGIHNYIAYIIGATNVIIGLINSFQRFGKAAEKTELHASAAMQYAMISRLLDTELSLSQEHMKVDLITSTRQDMDRLLSQSPMIPKKIIVVFNKRFPDLENKPDVCSDFGEETVYDTFRDFIDRPIRRATHIIRRLREDSTVIHDPSDAGTPNTHRDVSIDIPGKKRSLDSNLMTIHSIRGFKE